MEPLTLLVVMSLVAYRVTRLVVSDSFPPVARLRDAIVGADGEKLVGTKLETLGELLTCYWCASFWISGAVVAATDYFTSVELPFLQWWAVAAVAAFASYVEDVLYGWNLKNMAQGQLATGQLSDRRRQHVPGPRDA